MPKRDPEWEKENGHLYETVSVIEGYADDPHVFVKPAQSVAHRRRTTSGCSSDNLAAAEFEKDFIRFQVYTENCLYVVAEHLARYWAIFHKAGQDIHALMNPMIEKFARPNHPIGGEEHKEGNTFDIRSILVTAVVAATATVITMTSGVLAATAMVALGSAAIEALGEAIKTAKSNGTEVTLVLNDHDRLAGTAKEYLDAVNKIEREVADAVTQLGDSLYRRLGELREERQCQVTPALIVDSTADAMARAVVHR